MSTIAAADTLKRELQTSPSGAAARLTSLDAFRGLVILTMTYVNYLAGVRDIPAWAKHMPPSTEGYTFVDVVFPAFLFIVGVALPLSLHKRMAQGEFVFSLLRRILLRTASLILLGVIMVNSGFYSAKATGISKALWYLLAMLAVVASWNIYPATASEAKRLLFRALRSLGVLVLAGLLIAFRGENSAKEVVWLQHSWWGILGLIGWAYLVCSLAYLACGGSSTALMGVLGFLIILFIGDKHGALNWLGPVHNFIGVGPVLGSTAASTMTGVLVGNCFVGQGASLSTSARVRFCLVFGVALYAAGMLIRPLHGIEKNAATDAYTLVTGGICSLCFLLVYVVMDVARLRSWAGPLVLVGQNALLAYILPGILNNLVTAAGWPGVLWKYGSGAAGALNAAVLTLLVLVITWVATRAGIRLRL
jgi:heparan-alpha-glucosaminide N-acetyltransferase